MDFAAFDKFQGDLLAEVVAMKDTKAKEYANSADRFANFRRLAAQLNVTDAQVGWVYTAKHLDAIASFIRNGHSFSTEAIRGRFVDAVTYLTLIAGMIQEAADSVKPTLWDANAGKQQPFEYDPTPPQAGTPR